MMRVLVALLLASGIAHADPYGRIDVGVATFYARNIGRTGNSFTSANGFGIILNGAAGARVDERVALYLDLWAMRAGGSIHEDGGPFEDGDVSTLYIGAGLGVAYDLDDKTELLGGISGSVLWLDQRPVGSEPTGVNSDASATLVAGVYRRLSGRLGWHAKAHLGTIRSAGYFEFFALVPALSAGMTFH